MPLITNNFYSGTSNIVLPVPNKSFFPVEYQDKSRLRYYSSLFNSLEINSSFYKLPLAKTVASWSDDVPGSFKFTFKVWKEITHKKGLEFNSDDVYRFMNIVNTCNKKGCLLLQFPPGLFLNISQLNSLLAIVQSYNENNAWHVAVEFRNKSWYTQNTYQLLEKHNCSMVIHDMPSSATPLREINIGFAFLRFHGPENGYRGSYTDDVLSEYATYIKEWRNDGKAVYVYFNNTVGAAVHNLLILNKMVNGILL